jgi:hypothetical protein
MKGVTSFAGTLQGLIVPGSEAFRSYLFEYVSRNSRTTDTLRAAAEETFLMSLAPRSAACARSRKCAASEETFLICLAPRSAACALIGAGR